MSRVLVVEDEHELRRMMVEILLEAGFDVEDAADHREAIEIVEDGKPLDVIVTDILLPRVNGFALVRMATEKRADIKVVYVTGSIDPADEAVGPVLHKPFAAEVLVRTVRQVLALPAQKSRTETCDQELSFP
ncbi:MAG TPA: response regulator [Stellaceae bacterium]|nr:response regulator [Stellaceae bacterium]